MTRIISEGNAAAGLSRQGHRAEAFARLTYIHTVMDNNHLTLPPYWSAYYYASALVHDGAGERADALDDLRLSADLNAYGIPYVQRQLRRYELGGPLP